jgi:hypothetical protein
MPEEILSCIQQEPFIKLEENGTAPTLNYNLPQTTSFLTNVYLPVGIEAGKFKTALNSPPVDNYFDIVDTLDSSIIQANISNMYCSVISSEPSNPSVEVSTVYTVQPQMSIVDAIKIVPAPGLTPVETLNFKVNDQSIATIAAQALVAMPVTRIDLNGNSRMKFIPKPPAPKPQLVIVEHYRVNTYLKNYGAGKTIKTFSLLPGEKTKISIRSYKQTVQDKKQVENVLDAFSKDASTDLENMVQYENNLMSAESKVTNEASKIEGGGSISIDLGFGTIGAGGGASSTSNTTLNSSRTNSIRSLNNAISKQFQRSSANRQIQVNSETDTSATTEDETTIIRELENLNKSRVLNFVFRQLNQELLTLTYLDDVTFVYSNGYEESRKVAKLDGLKQLLTDILQNPIDVTTIYGNILNELSSVYDYNGNRQSFIEEVEEEIVDATNPSTIVGTQTYFKKSASLSQTAEGVTVRGIIKNVTTRVMPTESLVVDSLLGQGEALDCFNLHAQDAEIQRLQFENQLREKDITIKEKELDLKTKQLDIMQQQIDIIQQIPDPNTRADLYKKVFSSCCDVPQSCGCGNCNGNNQ